MRFVQAKKSLLYLFQLEMSVKGKTICKYAYDLFLYFIVIIESGWNGLQI